jgi:hypothetical protein
MIVVFIAIASTWLYLTAKRRRRLLEPARQQRPWGFAIAGEGAEFLLSLAVAAWVFTVLAIAAMLIDSPERTYATLTQVERWRAGLVRGTDVLKPAAFLTLVLSLGAYLLLVIDHARWRRVPQVIRTYRTSVGRAAKLGVALSFFTFFSAGLEGPPYDLSPRLRSIESSHAETHDVLTREVAERIATRLADSALGALSHRARAQLERDVALEKRIETIRHRRDALDPRARARLTNMRQLLDAGHEVHLPQTGVPSEKIARPAPDLTERRARQIEVEITMAERAEPTPADASAAEHTTARREVINAITALLAESLGFTVIEDVANSASRLARHAVGGAILKAAHKVILDAGIVPRVERAVERIQTRAARAGGVSATGESEEAKRKLELETARSPVVLVRSTDLSMAAWQSAITSRDLDRAERELRAAEHWAAAVALRERWDGALAGLQHGQESPTREALIREGTLVRDAFYRELSRLPDNTQRSAIDHMTAGVAGLEASLAQAAALTLAAVGRPVPRFSGPVGSASEGVRAVAAAIARLPSPLDTREDSRSQALRDLHARVARQVWGRAVEPPAGPLELGRQSRNDLISLPLVLRLSHEHLTSVAAQRRSAAERAAAERRRMEAELRRRRDIERLRLRSRLPRARR